jgi:hypothetical protein
MKDQYFYSRKEICTSYQRASKSKCLIQVRLYIFTKVGNGCKILFGPFYCLVCLCWRFSVKLLLPLMCHICYTYVGPLRVLQNCSFILLLYVLITLIIRRVWVQESQVIQAYRSEILHGNTFFIFKVIAYKMVRCIKKDVTNAQLIVFYKWWGVLTHIWSIWKLMLKLRPMHRIQIRREMHATSKPDFAIISVEMTKPSDACGKLVLVYTCLYIILSLSLNISNYIVFRFNKYTQCLQK